MLVEVPKKNTYTHEVMAFDGEVDLLVVDREGVQNVPDHAQVHALIAASKLKEVKVRKGGSAATDDTTEDKGEE
jgi:hypothetical protein